MSTEPRKGLFSHIPRRRGARKRMLIIVNPYATTVSDRLKNLVVYALQGRYDLEVVDTEAQNHATEIGREARHGHFDVVCAFGGDGTLNEVANGLAGSDIPVTVLPGGSTNVVCRTLGIPNDVIDATEHLLAVADRFEPRRIDLGKVNDRHFVFACGAGLDAAAAKRVDARPRLKARYGPYFYTLSAIAAFYSEFLRNPVRMRFESEAGSSEGITTIVQNSMPFTYFKGQEVRICEGVSFDSGTLSAAVLKRAAQRDIPSILARALTERFRIPKHRRIDHFSGLTEFSLTAVDDAPRGFPLEVDGDYIGDFEHVDITIDPQSLSVLA